MKNLIIAFLMVCLLVSLSFHYKMFKTSREPVFYDFPVSLLKGDPSIESPVYLLLFFSKTNCKDCLETFDFLDHLGPPFIIAGIVPDTELSKEMEFRNQTGVTFNLIGMKDFKKYAPLYGPSLMGVTGKGRILFLIPGIPGQMKCLKDFLETFYNKAFVLLSL